MNLTPYRKALTAFAVPAVAAIGAAMLDGDLTQAEILISAGTGLAAGAAVYAIPNSSDADGDGEHRA